MPLKILFRTNTVQLKLRDLHYKFSQWYFLPLKTRIVTLRLFVYSIFEVLKIKINYQFQYCYLFFAF